MPELAIWDLFSTVARMVPDRPAVLTSQDVVTFGELCERAERVASFLTARGYGWDDDVEAPRHEVVQPLIGIIASDCEQLIEVMYGCYRARAVPFTINFKYQRRELGALLADSRPVALFVAEELVPLAQLAVADLDAHVRAPEIIALTGEHPPENVTPYRVVREHPMAHLATPTAEDRYLLYTGGTTSTPKGTIWRQGDIAVASLGAAQDDLQEYDSLEHFARDVAARAPQRLLSGAPMMHGLGQWNCFRSINQGLTVVLPPYSGSLRPDEVVATCTDLRVTRLVVAGDAFALPLVEYLSTSGRELPDLTMIVTGSVHMSAAVKRRLSRAVPSAVIIDGVGGTETGGLMTTVTGSGDTIDAVTTFAPRPNVTLLDERRRRILPPGAAESGWLAVRHRIPCGYLRDPLKTASLFTVVDGVEYVVNGDRASWAGPGRILLIGRDSLVINTGGEKVYSEEVEAALREHPEVRDVLVCGVPDPRWGSRVAAMVAVHRGSTATETALRAFCREFLAAYKVPKQVLTVDAIPRSPAGKANYAWARAQLIAVAEMGVVTIDRAAAESLPIPTDG